jgi:hypothetical protein
MSSSSYRIIGGCYPDSVAKRIWKEYWKGVCLDTQIAFWGDSLSYCDMHEWDDSIGCISKEKWTVLRKEGWVDVTKSVFDSIEHDNKIKMELKNKNIKHEYSKQKKR